MCFKSRGIDECMPLQKPPESSNGLSSVQWFSPVRLFATPWTAAHQASLSITNSRSLVRLGSIESVMPSNHGNSLSPVDSTLDLQGTEPSELGPGRKLSLDTEG